MTELLTISSAGNTPELEQEVLAATPITKSQQCPGNNNANAVRRLLVEALRVSICFKPRWQGLPASPWLILLLILIYMSSHIGIQRLMILGPAQFYWQVFATGWFYFGAIAWACYCLRPTNMQASEYLEGSKAPSAAHFFALALAQTLVMNVVICAVGALLIRLGWYDLSKLSVRMQWLVYLTPPVVVLCIQFLFFWRASDRRRLAMLSVVIVMALACALGISTRATQFWYPNQERAETNDDEAESKSPEITQEIFEQQAALLNQKLQELKPHRPGIIDLYSLSFAPYGEENVFLNETSMVTQVMAKRFDAEGRSLQLANNPGTVNSLPWATPLNLQRAIRHIAKRMDVNEDILFLHMSSHGASDGVLSAGMWPLSVKSVTPEDLKRWLDEAGIKYRVISISACYAGNWVAPLSDENSLVMTASDADHTSYGCGSKSDLTFFGRAMYDEQLRNQTLSFEVAHAAARPIIKQREEEAGKSDGYSNPQIAVGEHIRTRLKLLEQRLTSAPVANAAAVK
ncbi:C13 family peptidase [Undibacterium sp. JH2W]|uniref:C13 family peptidase n=1 Tax=Undibacterium sp. JH2W TaxID=3413037 RepID=UPI003BF3E122